MKELEDDSDADAAQPRQRVFVERGDVHAVEEDAALGSAHRARPISPSSVDLPLPDGPVIATTRPRSMARSSG